MFGLRSPAIEPSLYDVRNTGDVIVQIAKGLGGTISNSFPWNDFQEALKEVIKGVFLSKRGSIQAKDFDEFWQTLVEQGGWWDPSYPLGSGGRNLRPRQASLSFSPRRLNDGSKSWRRKTRKDWIRFSKSCGSKLKETRSFFRILRNPV
jgi:hypothetical protein